MKGDREKFIHELAVYLAGDAAEMSIKLQLNREEALRWQRLRQTTPLFGWPTVEEAEKELREWLLPPLPQRRGDARW